MRKQSDILRKHLAFLLSQNTKMNNRITQMRKQSDILRKHLAILLAQNTKMNARNTEMKRQCSPYFLIAKYI